MYWIFGCLVVVGMMTPSLLADKRPMEVADLFRFKRVADPQISPDGKRVVYQITTVNLEENKSSTNLWVADTDGKTPPKQLTTTTKKDSHPRWSPDGSSILFESNRSGESQLWIIDLNGGEARQLTNISTGTSNGIWSSDGSHIAFVSTVHPEFSDKPFKESDALNKKKIDEAAKSPVKAKVFTRLFFRHWDSYVDDKRNHLFVIQSPDHKGEEFPEPKDVTPGDRDAYPTSTTFSVGDEFVFSPSGKFLVFTAPPERDEAWSTNYDICRVSIDGGKFETLTTTNKAADGSPRFSPSGGKLAWRGQKKPGYEADKWDLMVVSVDADGAFVDKVQNLTAHLDVSLHSLVWANRDSRQIVFTSDDDTGTATYLVHSHNGTVERFHWDRNLHGTISAIGFDLSGTRKPLNRAIFSFAKIDAPPEVYMAPERNWEEEKPVPPPTNISQANAKQLAEINLSQPESVKVPVAGAEMQMWLLKPPGFDPAKKWPVVYLVHGGPQSAWSDNWSFRWNPELWAAQGYVVAMPNPRECWIWSKVCR